MSTFSHNRLTSDALQSDAARFAALGWVDVSYSNDVWPSFSPAEGADLHNVLSVYVADPVFAEEASSPFRYHVCRDDLNGGEPVWEGNSWAALMDELRSHGLAITDGMWDA